MTIYRYEEISWRSEKSGECAVCGKHVKRQKKFTNTVNPWNRNPDGTTRTRVEVMANVQSLAARWQEQPVTHQRCEVTS